MTTGELSVLIVAIVAMSILILTLRDTWVSINYLNKKRKFCRRHWILRHLEGWYYPGWDGARSSQRWKFSCRYKDILRCSRTKHFKSCYAPDYNGVLTVDQPRRRCVNPWWAIVYVPDKRGDFMGRCFVELSFNSFRPTLTLYGLYGNQLFRDDIQNVLERTYWYLWLRVRQGPTDKTL